MKLTNHTKLGACALAGILSLAAPSLSRAALVGPTETNVPGEALGAGVPNFGGTVVGDLALGFIDTSIPTNSTGSLRSTVVRNAGGTLDFYYQLANTTPATPSFPDPEVFRLTLDAFSPRFSTAAGNSYEIFNVSNGLTGITGAGASVTGTNAAFSADREVGVLGRGIGFDFGDTHFVGDLVGPSTNLLAGQTGNFLVVRTNATDFRPSIANVIGAGSASVRTFVPVPEPATALVGLALSSFIGFTEFGRNRRRKAQPTKA